MAYWNFDQGTAGTAFSADSADDQSGNGYTMFGFNEQYGPSYSTVTPTGTGLSLGSVWQDGYTMDPAINAWSPQQFTIETAFRLNDVSGFKTLIGRDGGSKAAPLSDFYLQVNANAGGKLRADFSTVGGQRVTIDADLVPQTGQWYQAAVISDGATASLLVNDGTGWTNGGSVVLTGATPVDNALASPNANWTFGRGWYNNWFVDAINGNLDEIRFSDTALSTEQLLTVLPEPASVALLGLGGLCMATRRRR